MITLLINHEFIIFFRYAHIFILFNFTFLNDRSIYLFMCLFFNLSLLVYLFVYLFFDLVIYLFLFFQFIYLFIYLFIHPFIRQLIYLFVFYVFFTGGLGFGIKSTPGHSNRVFACKFVPLDQVRSNPIFSSISFFQFLHNFYYLISIFSIFIYTSQSIFFISFITFCHFHMISIFPIIFTLF